jgi:hypothetical protein
MSKFKSEAYNALRHHLDDLATREDEAFEDRLENYGDLWDGCDEDEIVRDFRSNYRAKGIGFEPFDHLTGDEITDAVLPILGRKGLVDLLCEHAEPRTCDYYVQWNEVFSVQIGEMEYQIDVEPGTELEALYDACTPEERADLRFGKLGTDRSVLVYGNPCERIIWKLDPETFLEAVTSTLRQAGLVDPDEAAANEATNPKTEA